MIEYLIPKRNYSDQDNKEFHPMINSSNGEWAIRYLWIQHRFDNKEFLKNYFQDGNKKNINVRKQTEDLTKDWEKHNRIFDNSLKDGNLIWRFKCLNVISESIDYIEVWRSADIIESYFDRSNNVNIPNAGIWHASDREIFAKNLWETGFDIRTWVPYASISRVDAMKFYSIFTEKLKNKEGCILNTPWNKILNP